MFDLFLRMKMRENVEECFVFVGVEASLLCVSSFHNTCSKTPPLVILKLSPRGKCGKVFLCTNLFVIHVFTQAKALIFIFLFLVGRLDKS